MSEPTAPTKVPRWADTSPTYLTEPPNSGTLSKDKGWDGSKPPTGFMNWLFNFIYQWIVWLRDRDAIDVGGAAVAHLTISSNAVTPTVAQNDFTATGTLHTIVATNFNSGRMLVLQGLTGKAVTLTHAFGGAGQMHLGEGVNVLLNATGQYVMFQYDGTDWWEVGRSASVPTAGRAKAWAKYTVAGNTLNAQYNVASCTRTGLGTYAVVFTTPMADVNYAVTMTPDVCIFPSVPTQLTTGFTAAYEDHTAAAGDPSGFSFEVHGN